MRISQLSLAALALPFVVAVAPAQVPTDAPAGRVPAALEQFRTSWREAWTRRDVDAVAALTAQDVDWIAADGTWLKGRRAFRDHHARLFAGEFREARWTTLDERVMMLDSVTALEIRATQIEDDTFADGTRRTPRRSVGTRIYVRRGERWWLQTSHNTIVAPISR
jgi:uncharacterized protein (TIGR02246 family)